jgi:hypothetical protein
VRAWTLLLFLLVAIGISTPAWAEVSEAEWTALVGEQVVLTNDAGKQIRGTLAAADGETITVVREDGKRVTVTKNEVSTAVYAGPPKPEPVPDPVVTDPGPPEQDTTIEPKPQPPEEPIGGPTAEAPPVEPASPAEPPAAQADPRQSAIAGEVEGRAAAQETGVAVPVGIGAGAAACAVGPVCFGCGPLGACMLPVAAAAPVAMGVFKPEPDPVALQGQDDAYVQAYTVAYQTELRRRRAIWGGVGAGAGVLVAGGAGLAGYYYVVNNSGSF